VRETHPTDPVTLYGIHKLLAEQYLRLYAAEFGMTAVAFRIGHPHSATRRRS